MAYIEFNDVKKIYKMGDVKIRALNGASFQINEGEFAVVLGPSGAGKSTILNILGGMDTCTTGEITVDGKELTSTTQDSLQHTEDMISDSYSSSIILYRILLSKKMLNWQRRYVKTLLILLRQ